MNFSLNLTIRVRRQLFFLLASCYIIYGNDEKKLEGVYYQDEENVVSDFIYYQNGHFMLGQPWDFRSVIVLKDGLGLEEYENTLVYKKIYDYTFIAPVFDSVMISNLYHCTLENCYVYDCIFYKTGIVRAKIHFPYAFQGNYEFKVSSPLVYWFNRSCNSLDVNQPINLFKNPDTEHVSPAFLSIVFFKGDKKNYFYGDLSKLPFEVYVMGNVIQQVMKLHIPKTPKRYDMTIKLLTRDSLGGDEAPPDFQHH